MCLKVKGCIYTQPNISKCKFNKQNILWTLFFITWQIEFAFLVHSNFLQHTILHINIYIQTNKFKHTNLYEKSPQLPQFCKAFTYYQKIVNSLLSFPFFTLFSQAEDTVLQKQNSLTCFNCNFVQNISSIHLKIPQICWLIVI